MKMKSVVAAFALALAAPANAQTPGVTDTEIKIGSAQDLSGLFAAFSVPAVTAVQMHFDKINAAGGIHGRKLTYIVEDHGYQVPKAVQAANKLVNRDQVFAMLNNLGTPHNIAMFQLMGPQGIPNVAPITAARQMVEPFESWKFIPTATYYAAIKEGASYLIDEQGTQKFCTMLLPTDFGKEIEEAIHEIAKARGQELGAELAHKPDETDFTGAFGKIKASGCDTVAVGLGISQMINAIATARKLGMTDVKFLLSGAGFHTVVAQGLAAQGVNDGVYAVSGWQDLASRMDVPEVAAWVGEFKAASGDKFPGSGAVLGYSGAVMVTEALEAAGRDLTREGFIKAMETLDYEDVIAGNTIAMSADDHASAEEIFVSVVDNGGWKLIETIK
ncbi:ABC transporter substrate-binding protein [Pukyongiella litopenaei]|uniref:ABC transporter substrate-binding protein n=1 Tax=Pukyongiella litopenaei TaxID=2605946 RepID=A0A2S0MQ33_9RHOB|nr:ABC transporter substrate-binding protein [Pukyongiella litopenaei]AVO37974.1 ABC transporter substrate-binding protein [Pukyongiella litopenaei]